MTSSMLRGNSGSSPLKLSNVLGTFVASPLIEANRELLEGKQGNHFRKQGILLHFWRQSGHRSIAVQCPLLTQSGHRRVREGTLVMIPGDHLRRLGCDAKDDHERLAA